RRRSELHDGQANRQTGPDGGIQDHRQGHRQHRACAESAVGPQMRLRHDRGPSQSPIAPGETAFYTCSHVLSAVGVYTNVATETAEGGGKELTRTSNEVEVEAREAPRPGFETKKEQRLSGEASYTTAKLTGKLGQTVEYKITV